MKHIVAICSAVLLTLVPGSGNAQSWRPASSSMYGERPPPPTEPSIAIPAPVAALPAPKSEPAKPAVWRSKIRRAHISPIGPVQMPSQDVLVMMVRAVLAGVNQANFTENYSVLHSMTTPDLQSRVSAAKLRNAFAGLRKQNLDLSPALVLLPQFTSIPSIDSQGVLKTAGLIPSKPWQIRFAIDYRPVDGFWLIDALSVSAVPAANAVASALPATIAPPTPAPITPSANPATPTGPTTAAIPANLTANSGSPASTVVPKRNVPNARDEISLTTLPSERFVPANTRAPIWPAYFSTSVSDPRHSKLDRNYHAVDERTGRNGRNAYVQVSSQRTEKAAHDALRSLRARYPQLLGQQPSVIKRIDLGSRGVFYRAQIGPLSADQADAQCTNLRSAGVQCLVR